MNDLLHNWTQINSFSCSESQWKMTDVGKIFLNPKKALKQKLEQTEYDKRRNRMKVSSNNYNLLSTFITIDSFFPLKTSLTITYNNFWE